VVKNKEKCYNYLKMTSKVTIGPAEKVVLPELGQISTIARIDTGAQTSAIWATAKESKGMLSVVFLGEGSPLYTGKKTVFEEFATTSVTNSTGGTEERYKVRLLVEIGGRRVRAWFTLANRSKQTYPILIGRNILRGKFVVDISHGKAVSGKLPGGQL
jgi:hypothetical protein